MYNWLLYGMKFFHRHLIEVMGEKNLCCFLFMIIKKINITESKFHQTDNVVSSYLHACLNLYKFIQIKVKSNTFVNCLDVE